MLEKKNNHNFKKLRSECHKTEDMIKTEWRSHKTEDTRKTKYKKMKGGQKRTTNFNKNHMVIMIEISDRKKENMTENK
jgi:hypothetical protein